MKKLLKKIFSFIKKYLTVVIIGFLFLFLFICNKTSFGFGNDLIRNLKSITTSFTPTTDLFDDGSEVSFVSYFFGMKAKKGVLPTTDYYYPVCSQNLSSNSSYLLFNYDGIVFSSTSGRVKNVGFNENNQKFIQIEQTDRRICVYEGLDTIGVTVGDYVHEKKPIGIASSKTYLKFYIQDNDLNLDLSEIQWKE